jgi:hypothetical protein
LLAHFAGTAFGDAKDLPYLIQYFIKSLGRDVASCSDLISYLLLTSQYTNALIEIGYSEAGQRAGEIEQFLCASDQGAPAHIYRPKCFAS